MNPSRRERRHALPPCDGRQGNSDMFRFQLFAGVAVAALLAGAPSAFSQADSSASGAVETVTVTAKRLSAARDTIQTQIGASTYTFDSTAIESQPGGTNNSLNQVILQ